MLSTGMRRGETLGLPWGALDFDDHTLEVRQALPQRVKGRPLELREPKSTESAGLGHWHPHELRHSAASIMLAQGIPLEVVSEVLGHSSIRMTKDVYGHLIGHQKREAAAAVSKALWGDGRRGQ